MLPKKLNYWITEFAIDISAIYDGASISFKRKITLNGDKTVNDNVKVYQLIIQ